MSLQLITLKQLQDRTSAWCRSAIDVQLNVTTTNQPGAVWQIDENQNNVRKVWNKFQDKRKPKIGEDVDDIRAGQCPSTMQL